LGLLAVTGGHEAEEKMVRRLTKHIFFTFLATLVMVFIVGILLGRHLERSVESELTGFLIENDLDSESYLIEQALIKGAGEDGCDLAQRRISDLSYELASIGQRLSMEGVDEVLGEKSLNLLKRRYHLTQVRTYLLFGQLMDTCDMEEDIVLFYYGEDAGKSVEQGRILDSLVAEKGITVFAVEYNYSKELNFIEHYYNITETPTLVIDFNETYEGLVDKETLSSLIG